MYTNARGIPPRRVSPYRRAYLERLVSISGVDKIRDFDEEFDNNDDFSMTFITNGASFP